MGSQTDYNYDYHILNSYAASEKSERLAYIDFNGITSYFRRHQYKLLIAESWMVAMATIQQWKK